QKNPAHLDALDPIIEQYTIMTQELLRVPVPAPLAQRHLALVNTMQVWVDNVAGMKLAFEDPLAALIRVQGHTDGVTAFAQAAGEIRRALEAAGIMYNRSEGGAFFFGTQL